MVKEAKWIFLKGLQTFLYNLHEILLQIAYMDHNN